MKNTGVEMMLGYRGKIGNDLKFDVTGNVATYRNKVTSVPASVINNYGGDGNKDNIWDIQLQKIWLCG